MIFSTYTVSCGGCSISETHPINHPEDFHLIKNNGWVRREFGPGANVWFCSNDCAYNSNYAIEVQKFWDQKHFESYCKSDSLFWFFAGIVAMNLLVFYIISEYYVR
jgi:hypothetical protein